MKDLMLLKKHKKLVIVAVIAVALLGYVSYNFFKKPEISYMTVHAQNRDIQKRVYATGTIEGIEQVNVGAQVSGQILKLYVQTGDDVKKGDLLCEIDPKIQESALKTAKAQISIIEAQTRSKQAEIKKLKYELDRQKTLIKTNATSKQDLEVADANYIMAVAALEQLQAQKEQAQLSLDDATTNLGYTKILAPFDGTVYATVVSEGETVNANQTTPTILRLANLEKMKVSTEISEADVVNVRTGMDCSFTILGLPYRTFEGKLSRIDPAPSSYKNASTTSASSSSSSSSTSNSTAIYYNSDIIADNQDRTLRIDMTADVVINIDSRNKVLSLPLTAIRTTKNDESASVYVLEEDRVVERQIKVGLKDDQYIEVVSGLNDKDAVVIGDDVQTAQALAIEKDNKRRRGPF